MVRQTDVLVNHGGALGRVECVAANNTTITDGARLLPAPKIHKHHIFPQSKREWFKQRAIEVDDFTVPLEQHTHLSGVHGRGGFVGPGNVYLPGKWNQRWNEFFEANPNATMRETYQFGGKLMDEFGLNKLPIIPFK